MKLVFPSRVSGKNHTIHRLIIYNLLIPYDTNKHSFVSTRFLSLHKNRLTRITVEELRAMPQLSGLDISRNPLRCDEDLSAAIQWLTDKSVTPTESVRGSNGGASKRSDYDYEGYATGESDAVSQWTDLGKKLCDSWEGGPPPRPAPKKPAKKVQSAGAQAAAAAQASAEDGGLPTLPGPFIKFDFSDDVVFSGNKVSFRYLKYELSVENNWASGGFPSGFLVQTQFGLCLLLFVERNFLINE